MTVAALIAFLQTQPGDRLVLTEWSYNVFIAASPEPTTVRPIKDSDEFVPCLPAHPDALTALVL